MSFTSGSAVFNFGARGIGTVESSIPGVSAMCRTRVRPDEKVSNSNEKRDNAVGATRRSPLGRVSTSSIGFSPGNVKENVTAVMARSGVQRMGIGTRKWLKPPRGTASLLLPRMVDELVSVSASLVKNASGSVGLASVGVRERMNRAIRPAIPTSPQRLPANTADRLRQTLAIAHKPFFCRTLLRGGQE